MTLALQWGRDSLVAEMCGSPVVGQDTPRLQWGRDSLVAEIPKGLSQLDY